MTLRVLTFTSLYPSSIAPGRGVFVENRLRHLVAGGRVDARVVAPVPWFPFGNAAFGRYAQFAKVPRRETRHGIEVLHPRYATVPGIGMNATPLAMALGARAAVESLRRSGFDFDVIDAHYFYPDGVAAAMLSRWFDRPLVITARGSDIAHLPEFALPRRMILWAARRAAAIVAVCNALRTRLVELGADGSKIQVLRNGVDLDTFRPVDRAAARASLGLPADAFVIASVGHLIPLKGHDLVIEALASLPDATLLIAGHGQQLDALRHLAGRIGVASRVRFLGEVPHAELPQVYGASDALVLASESEGWANVLLEAMACGTPVVSTDVGGSNEVVTTPDAGVLIRERSAAAIADALRTLRAAPPLREATRRYAERFSWDDTTRGQESLFEAVLRARAVRSGDAPLVKEYPS